MPTMQPAPTELAVADDAVAPAPTGGESPQGETEDPRARRRRRVRRAIRVVLIAWWSAIGFVFFALLGNILVVPLAQTPNRWWDGVQSQIAGLLALAQTYPTQTAVGAFVVFVLTFLSFVENRALNQARQKELDELKGRVTALEQGRTRTKLPPNVVAPTGMPLAVSFVGRVAELEDVKRRLREGSDAVGVFAVEGLPGVGKTALAAQATGELAADTRAFPGGAIWVACEGREGASGLAEIWMLVASAIQLDVSQVPDAEARRQAVARALSQTPRRLITLDNVEPGLDALALIDTLSIPGHTALLLTARQAVAPSRATPIELGLLPEGDAVQLFVERLHQRDEKRPTAEERGTIPALVAAMDGLPLAVELTAAYAASTKLPLAKVVSELQEDGVQAPAFNPQTPSEAGRALVARFDRSWRVLSATQRRLFAGLSLLARTSFPREAALSLASDAANEGEPARAAGDLAALEGYALVEALPGGERLRLHPKLREYAASKLDDPKAVDPAVAARLGDAMTAYWLAYAQKHPGYEGMDALEGEADGLMGALEWAHENERNGEVLKLGYALGPFWYSRGHIQDRLMVYPWALEAAKASSDTSGERWATHQLAVVLAGIGRLEQARAGYARALELARQLHDPAAERAEVHSLAVLDLQTGRLDEARAGFARALELARQLHDPAAERDEVHGLAVLDAQTGRLEQARAGYERALELAQQLHDPAAERDEVHGLAVLESQLYHLDEAQKYYEQALTLARQVQDPAAEATELQNFGVFLARKRGQRERGRAMIVESLSICERLDAVYEIGNCHQFLAWIDEDEGNREGAIAHYREALRRFAQVQSPDAEAVRRSLLALGAEA